MIRWVYQKKTPHRKGRTMKIRTEAEKEYRRFHGQKGANMNKGYFDTYYTLYTDEDGVTLYKGFCDQGKRDTATETSVLSFSYEAAGIDDPHTDDDSERVQNWEKIDRYISARLGFCPDYE